MLINVFTFSPVQQVVELTLYTEKQEHTHPECVCKDECPELWGGANENMNELIR